MRIAEIIGTVTLNRAHPSLTGSRFLLAVPFSLKGLRQDVADGEDFVLYDNLGANAGCRVGVSEGAEAAVPFLPKKKPIDAYCACILDQVVIEER
jgi:microcompartment protein CcmK/EutM